MKFSDKLKALREAKGFTQEEIASKLNIARQSVSKWEQGINEPDFDTVKKLCVILDCSIADLIDSDREVVSSAEVKQEKRAGMLFNISLFLLALGSLMVIAFLFVATPEIITHFSSNGNETLGSKFALLLNLIPIALGVLLTLFTRIYGKRSHRYASYKMVMQVISLIVDIILIATAMVLSVLMIKDHNLGGQALMNLLTAGVLGLIVSAVPFTHPHFNPRNPLFGFRSNFTLSSDEAWRKVNAFSSIALTLAALTGYTLTLIFMEKDFAVVFIASILLGIIPCIIYHEILRSKQK